MADAEETVAWMACPYRAPVLDTEGGDIGTAESLLADQEEDIFHGLAVKLRDGGALVEVSADEVVRITRVHVYTNVSPARVAGLPAYREQKWFHLGWGGHFRKHPEWDPTEQG